MPEPKAADLARLAWEARLGSRGRVIRFDRLTATKAVSVTGRACGASCAHCGGHYLKAMLTPRAARRLAARSAGGGDGPGPEVKSWLVSGGCDVDGRVPLLEDRALLEDLARSGPLNLHAGLVRSEDEAEAIAERATAVSFDFVVDDETIREIYGFKGVTGEDFRRSFVLLSRYARVVPHVLIGLRGGRVHGEREALRELARLGAEGVVLLVLIPTPGSRFGAVAPPPLEDVASVVAEARLIFPSRPVHLGCMRPKGSYRAELDVMAVRAGVDRVAVPTPGAVREAGRLGLEAVWSDECCVFSEEDLGRPVGGGDRR